MAELASAGINPRDARRRARSLEIGIAAGSASNANKEPNLAYPSGAWSKAEMIWKKGSLDGRAPADWEENLGDASLTEGAVFLRHLRMIIDMNICRTRKTK